VKNVNQKLHHVLNVMKLQTETLMKIAHVSQVSMMMEQKIVNLVLDHVKNVLRTLLVPYVTNLEKMYQLACVLLACLIKMEYVQTVITNV